MQSIWQRWATGPISLRQSQRLQQRQPGIYRLRHSPGALEDETFRAMITEAEKYLGYPYVWGGSSPSTSFDCSGFISWVINHSGWDVGRLTANGLLNISTPVSRENARPGDLIFFQGTYDTAGASHVGLYVGDGMMITAGPRFLTQISTPLTGSSIFTPLRDCRNRKELLYERQNQENQCRV